MNKIFMIAVIIMSFCNLLYFNLKDVLTFQPQEPAEYSFLKDFNKEFPYIKEVGFYSDIENPVYVSYRIQNSVIPVILKHSAGDDYMFCYSPDRTCRYFLDSRQADLLKIYSPDLFLFKKPEGIK